MRPEGFGWSLFDYASGRYPTDVYGGVQIIDLIISSNFGYEGFEKMFKVDFRGVDVAPPDGASGAARRAPSLATARGRERLTGACGNAAPPRADAVG